MKTRLMLIAAAALAICGCKGRPADRSGTPAREAVRVEVMRVRMDSSATSKAYVATVQAGRTVLLSAKHSGTLSSLTVKKGDRVKAGQALAQIESQTVKSSHEMAHATLDQAEDGYRRAEQVYRSGSIAEVKMVEITTKLNQARAAAASADKALEDCTIKAPFDGYADDVFAEQGVELDILSPVVRIVDLSSCEIHFSVPEGEVKRLSVGQGIRLDVSALGIEGRRGRVRSKGVSASPLSHCYDCIAVLDSAPEGLMPGMVCKLSLIEGVSPRIIVPASALLTGSEGRYLWLAKDGKAVKRAVKTGGFSGKGIVITDGLKEGDMVITGGYQKVSGGMEVKAEESPR